MILVLILGMETTFLDYNGDKHNVYIPHVDYNKGMADMIISTLSVYHHMT
jgi:hypothetical protein